MRLTRSVRMVVGTCSALILGLVLSPVLRAEPASLEVLFLGDNGPHRPAERFRQLQPVLAARGIELTYSDQVEALNSRTLDAYDALLVYANIDTITDEQEQALVEFVEGGKGFIPIHCASYCFRNSSGYVELVGAQFQRHGTGIFRTTIAAADHPVMEGFGGFESWDETYVHTKHNQRDRTVLEYREEQGQREPWTWVRTQGQGRVFYTAWGHDGRTWGHPGFHNLVERGIRWACRTDPAVVPAFADRPEMTERRTDVKPLEYREVPGQIPDYRQGRGKTLSRMQQPLEPAESAKYMVHPVDFQLQLFASEQELGEGKPICMNWDEQGRLWVALTVDYPNELQPPGQGRDRIVVCQDTNQDGRADQVTVFADRLSIPTGLTFAGGGVIVHQAPHTLLLKDTTGDGVADRRQVLFSGWGTGDTHAGPSNLQYGLDNWIYGIVGYSGFNGTVGGEQHRFGQGFYRFLPDGSKLEFLRSTNNNSWGVGFSEEGLLFGSTANGNPSVHLPVPNRYYESVRGWSSSVLGTIADSAQFHPITERVRQVDHHGNFTAAAGHALYTARTYPRQYWNQTAFVTDPTGHLVATFQLQPDGSSFRSRNAWNLLASADEWTAPIMAEVGPDGQVWVIDWYSYIVQHNPAPPGFKTGKGNAYETPLRDQKYGRIYRVVYRGAEPQSPLTLQDASPDKLLATLQHSNLFWRRHAQRLLIERGQSDVVPQLLELAADGAVDPIGLNPGVIHALWTLHGLGELDDDNAPAVAAATAALRHKSAGVRRNAVQVLPRDTKTLPAIVDAGLFEDADAQVRLAALLTLAELPASSAAADALLAALQDPATTGDRGLTDALTSAAARHHEHFLPALARQWDRPLSGRQEELVQRVAEHHARGAPSRTVGTLLAALADGHRSTSDAVVAGLVQGWPAGQPPALDAETEKTLGRLLARLSPATRSQLVALAVRWGSQALDQHVAELAASLLEQAADQDRTDQDRIQAAAQLIGFQRADAAAADRLLQMITPRTPPELAQGLLAAVARSEAPGLGEQLIALLPSLTPGVKAAAIRTLLGRNDWTGLLLQAIEQRQVQLGELSLEQRQGLAFHPDRAMAEKAKDLLDRGGGLPSPDRQQVIDELMPLVRQTGDPQAGKALFKTHCAKCHTHSGEGQKIGPDLTGMAVHPKAHLLVEILDPSRSVEGNYRQYVVATSSGRVLTGLLASESKTAVELVDPEGKTHTLLREDIDELQATPKSLMPEGFEKQLKPGEIVDLLEFLAHRGQFLPVPLESVATVNSTRGMFYSEDAQAERLIFPDWSPKTFQDVPFHLVDPQGGRAPNVILLYGPQGTIPPKMPKSVRVPCNAPAKAIHLLSGVSGWGYPVGRQGSVSMIVRLHYADGTREDHPLKNGVHFADYIRRVDVPESQFAFALRSQQIRYLAVHPERGEPIGQIELVKGPDASAPIIMALTVETRPGM